MQHISEFRNRHCPKLFTTEPVIGERLMTCHVECPLTLCLRRRPSFVTSDGVKFTQVSV